MKQKIQLAIVMLFTIFAITITSCGSDKSDEPQASNPLVGTWEHELKIRCGLHDKKWTEGFVFTNNGTGYRYDGHTDGTMCDSPYNFKYSFTLTEIHLVYDDGSSDVIYYTIPGNTAHFISDYNGDMGVFVRK